MYEIKDLLKEKNDIINLKYDLIKDSKIYDGRIIIENKNSTLTKIWISEDQNNTYGHSKRHKDKWLKKFVQRVKDDYPDFLLNYGGISNGNQRIGSYITYKKIIGYSPTHTRIFKRWDNVDKLYEELMNFVIDTTIKSKWKNRDWTLKNIIVDNNNKFHIIDLDSITQDYNYYHLLGMVREWKINHTAIDDKHVKRLKVLEYV